MMEACIGTRRTHRATSARGAVHVHNDLIMTAKQKRLEARDFIGARVAKSSFVADPLEGLVVQRLVAGCEGTAVAPDSGCAAPAASGAAA